MLAFALAVPGDNTQIFQYSDTNDFKVWGAWNAERSINTVTIINKRPNGSPVDVDVQVPFGYNFVKRVSMEAPGGLTALSGITIAGMMYDVESASFVGEYTEDVLQVFNGVASVRVAPESLSIVFVSREDLGNVLQPAIDGTVTSNENGEIVGDVSQGRFKPNFGNSPKPGSKFLGGQVSTRFNLSIGLLFLSLLLYL